MFNFADKCVLQSAFYKVLVIDSNVVKIFRDFFVDSSTHLPHFLAVVRPQALHRVDLAVSDGLGVEVEELLGHVAQGLEHLLLHVAEVVDHGHTVLVHLGLGCSYPGVDVDSLGLPLLQLIEADLVQTLHNADKLSFKPSLGF